MIGRRLSRLPDVANDVLRTAAVIGPTFTFRLVETVVDVDGDGVIDAFDAAVASGLVSETTEGYEFSHALGRRRTGQR